MKTKPFTRIIAIIITLCAALSCFALSGCGDNGITVAIQSIDKHGNVTLDATFAALRAHDIEVGDVVTVTVGDQKFDLPVGTNYTDVDSGDMICRFDLQDEQIKLAINMGSFATKANIGEKQTIEETPGYRWDVKIAQVTLVLKQKEGFLAEYNARHLTRSDNRDDYPTLSDAQYANFRAIATTGLKADFLYRSSSPLDPALSRARYAQDAMQQAGIQSVVDLADSQEAMQAFDAYQGYYNQCAVLNPEMNYDFGSQDFAQDVRDSLMFIVGNEGPYLIHCKEGKDRTGVLCALIECFLGASLDEVAADYMQTFYNFYLITPQDETYAIVLNNNLVKTLQALYSIQDLKTADLKAASTAYFLSIGLAQADLDALYAKLHD